MRKTDYPLFQNLLGNSWQLKILWAAVVLCLLVPTLKLVAAEPNSASENITIEEQGPTIKLRIPTRDGNLVWGDVVSAIARVRGYDDRIIEDSLPSWFCKVTDSFQLDKLDGINSALGPHINLRLVKPRQRQSKVRVPELQVTVNRAALLKSKRKLKQRIRNRAAQLNPSRELIEHGLHVSTDQRLRAGTNRKHQLVVFVHGYNSCVEEMLPIVRAAKSKGFACGTFSYPNDQSIAESAKLLSRDLKQLSRAYPNLQVNIVAHSMGGLVARAVIENPKLDARNVQRLVMLGTPNQGSNLARFAVGTDLWEYFRGAQRNERTNYLETFADGMGEAAVDLRPNSLFLRELNSRPRNPNVGYTLFLGNHGFVRPDEARQIQRRVDSFVESNRWLQFVGSKVANITANLDEVVDGTGDGVVALKRGRLAGVNDTRVRPFAHVDIVATVGNTRIDAIRAEVFSTLQ